MVISLRGAEGSSVFGVFGSAVLSYPQPKVEANNMRSKQIPPIKTVNLNFLDILSLLSHCFSIKLLISLFFLSVEKSAATLVWVYGQRAVLF